MKTFILYSLISLLAIFKLYGQTASDTSLIKKHLQKITQTENYRNYQNVDALNTVAEYIYREFEKYADTTYYQEYTAQGETYKNVICTFGSENENTIVVGAHYDVCGDQEGADDNASGVVALLELVRMLKAEKLKYKIEIVAFTLEEPPFYYKSTMGSFVHAKSLNDEGRAVEGMVCLDMIGYFDESKHSQKYPIPVFSLIYGTKGNFITLLRYYNNGKFSRKFMRKFKRKAEIRTIKFKGFKFMLFIMLSDNLNYNSFDYSTVLITNTATYRNMNYHEVEDSCEKLDVKSMARVINSLYKTILEYN